MKEIFHMNIYVKTQAELDAIPLDTKDFVYIDFGTKEKPAIVRERYWYTVKVINNSVVTTYGNSEVLARNNSIVYAYGNSKVDASVNSTVYVHENSKVYACSNSKIYAYDNSNVWAHNDKNIVSINDNAIVTSPSILCSGAKLLNQCNGNVGDVKFAVSNVPDEDKDDLFGIFCDVGDFSERVFVLTMQNTPYYCIYSSDTMSVKFYTMGFCCAFENIADDTVFTYYLANVLMPALVNTKFDKNAKSNII